MYPDSAGLDRMNVEFAKLGTMGVTVMAATGDGGSHFSFQFFGSDPIGTLLNQVSAENTGAAVASNATLNGRPLTILSAPVRCTLLRSRAR